MMGLGLQMTLSVLAVAVFLTHVIPIDVKRTAVLLIHVMREHQVQHGFRAPNAGGAQTHAGTAQTLAVRWLIPAAHTAAASRVTAWMMAVIYAIMAVLSAMFGAGQIRPVSPVCTQEQSRAAGATMTRVEVFRAQMTAHQAGVQA